MNHLEQFLALLGDLGLVVCAIGWACSAVQGRRDYRAGWDDGWDERGVELERTKVTAVLLEEAAEDMAGPTLLTDTQQPPGQQAMSDEEYEVYAASHVISQELAALAAEDVPRPEGAPTLPREDYCAGPGHLESTQEWQARMDLEAAQWCARHGLRHESAWAA